MEDLKSMLNHLSLVAFFGMIREVSKHKAAEIREFRQKHSSHMKASAIASLPAAIAAVMAILWPVMAKLDSQNVQITSLVKDQAVMKEVIRNNHSELAGELSSTKTLVEAAISANKEAIEQHTDIINKLHPRKQ